MLKVLNEIDARFSETQVSEFAHESNFLITDFLENHEDDFSVKEIQLIKEFILADCLKYGW